MNTVETLQERLEEKARERAKSAASYAVSALPEFDEVQCWGSESKTHPGKVVINDYQMREGLRQAIYARLCDQYLKEETDNLLAACEQVRELVQTREDDE